MFLRKQYQNRSMFVKVIASQSTVVFWDTMYKYLYSHLVKQLVQLFIFIQIVLPPYSAQPYYAHPSAYRGQTKVCWGITSYLVAMLLNCCFLSSKASCSRHIRSVADLWTYPTLKRYNKHGHCDVLDRKLTSSNILIHFNIFKKNTKMHQSRVLTSSSCIEMAKQHNLNNYKPQSRYAWLWLGRLP